MLFSMLLFLAIAMIPAGVVFGILLLVERQKVKRMQHILNLLVQSGKISQAEYYAAISGKNVPQQMYPQSQQSQGYPQAQQSQGYPQAQQSQGYPQAQQSQGYPQAQQPHVYPQAQQSQGYPQTQQPQGYPQAQQPQGYPQVQPSPQYIYPQTTTYPTNTQSVHESGKASSANFLLVAGVFLVILAGVIFATTTWEQLISPIKVSLLFLSSALFFGVSVLADKKFGLRQTGIAFYSLGSVFLPVAVLAVGFLELFGNWLSFYGRGSWLLGVIASVPLGIAFYYGHRVYKKPILYWLFFFSIAACIVSTALFINDTIHMFAIGMTVFSVVLMLLSYYREQLRSLKTQAEVFVWISTGLGLMSGLASIGEMALRSYVDVCAMIVVALIILILMFKIIVEKSDIAKHLVSVFILLFTAQCFINMSVLIDKSTALYFSVTIVALGVLFEFIRDKSKTPLLRTIASDIIFCSVIFVSTFLTENNKLETGVIWLCLFVLLSLFGKKLRGMRFLRAIPLFFFGYMLTAHFVDFAYSYQWPIFVGTLLLLIFAAFPIPFLSGKGQYLSDSRLSFLISGGVTTAFLEIAFFLSSWTPENIPLFICATVLIIFGVAIAYYYKNLFSMIFPMMLAIPFFSNGIAQLSESVFISLEGQIFGFLVVLMFLLFMTAGRLFHKRIYTEKTLDIFTVSAFVAPFCAFFIFDAWWSLAGWLMLGAYGFSFLERVGDEKIEKILALLGSISVCIAIYTQTIFGWNDMIQVKVFLLLPFLVLLLCRVWLFSSSKQQLGSIVFGYGIFTSAVLFIEAMANSRIFDALFLGVLAILIIVVSFVQKSKRWFLLSGTTTIVVALYLSRNFWSNLAWWVYLLVGGGILIAIAVISEVNRHREKSVKKNILSYFEDWSR